MWVWGHKSTQWAHLRIQILGIMRISRIGTGGHRTSFFCSAGQQNPHPFSRAIGVMPAPAPSGFHLCLEKSYGYHGSHSSLVAFIRRFSVLSCLFTHNIEKQVLMQEGEGEAGTPGPRRLQTRERWGRHTDRDQEGRGGGPRLTVDSHPRPW